MKGAVVVLLQVIVVFTRVRASFQIRLDSDPKVPDLPVDECLINAKQLGYPGSSSGVIIVPGNGEDTYENSDSKCWIINAPEGKVVTLDFAFFDLEFCDNGDRYCYCDYLNVHDGVDDMARIIGMLCGSSDIRRISSLTNRMFLRFFSDSEKTRAGFNVSFSTGNHRTNRAEHRVTVCDDDDGYVYAACEVGFVRITSIKYGRAPEDTRSCHDNGTEIQVEESAACSLTAIDSGRLRLVEDRCNGQRLCGIQIRSEQLEDFACQSTVQKTGVRVTSYAVVTYVCDTTQWCSSETDEHGTKWMTQASGDVDIQPCTGGTIGTARRICEATASGTARWSPVDQTSCFSPEILQLTQATNYLITKEFSDATGDTASVAVNMLLTSLNVFSASAATSGDVAVLSDVSDGLLDYWMVNKLKAEQDFLNVSSNLLLFKDMWQNLAEFSGGHGVSRLMTSVGRYAGYVANWLRPGERSLLISENIVVHAEVQTEESAEDYVAFTGSEDGADLPPWLLVAGARVFLPADAIRPHMAFGNVSISSVFYQHLQAILGVSQDESSSPKLIINSIVADVTINSGLDERRLAAPLSLSFEHLETSSNSTYVPMCVYWDFNLTNASDDGGWSTMGGKAMTSSKYSTVCRFDHLTNFALIMRVTPYDDRNAALDTISRLGHISSTISLAATILVYLLLWRSLRSPRTILLLNLCLSLFLATFSFLVGIDKVSNQNICKTIAVFLHYLYLVVFCAMLFSGVHLYMLISSMQVDHTKKRAYLFVSASWGIPGVIVAISLAATRTEGYGSDTYCWLTNQNMLMLAFVIPVGTVVCANIVLLALVFRAMFHSQAVRRKTNRERVGTTLRSLCVLVPLLGVTWIFGFLQSIDYLSEVSQYLFVILNSIQGLFIFVFHCLLDARVREAATRRWRQRSTLIMARQDVSAQTTNSRMSRTFHALRSLTTTSSRISQTSRNSAFTPMLKSQTSEQKSNVQSPGTDRKTETSI